MQPGTAQVRGSWSSFFLFGASMQELYFDEETGSTPVLLSQEKTAAFHCSQCGGLFVKGRMKERWKAPRNLDSEW